MHIFMQNTTNASVGKERLYLPKLRFMCMLNLASSIMTQADYFAKKKKSLSAILKTIG